MNGRRSARPRTGSGAATEPGRQVAHSAAPARCGHDQSRPVAFRAVELRRRGRHSHSGRKKQPARRRRSRLATGAGAAASPAPTPARQRRTGAAASIRFRCASTRSHWAPRPAAVRSCPRSAPARPVRPRARRGSCAPAPRSAAGRRRARCPGHRRQPGGPASSGWSSRFMLGLRHANPAMQPRNCSRPRRIHVFTVPAAA